MIKHLKCRGGRRASCRFQFGMRRRCVALILAMATAAILEPTGQSPAAIIADSVAQFSDVQGQDNWYYGYIAPANGPGFIEFPTFDATYPGGAAWVIDPLAPNPPWPDHYFTVLWADRGMDNSLITSANKPADQWDDRRWISTVNGTLSISGLFGIDTPGGLPDEDGVIAEILVNGTLVWQQVADANYAVSPYATSATVSVGSVVDFVVLPRTNDFLDEHTFTAVMQTPEPTGLSLLVAGMTTLSIAIWVKWRRASPQARSAPLGSTQ
jgi:hypothetical protein